VVNGILVLHHAKIFGPEEADDKTLRLTREELPEAFFYYARQSAALFRLKPLPDWVRALLAPLPPTTPPTTPPTNPPLH